MALVKKIKTTQGDLQIDYNALANKPSLTPTSLGALPSAGGTMTGNISFSGSDSGTADLRWTTKDGTIFRMRPDYAGNTFQILTTKGSTDISVFTINSDGKVGFTSGASLPVVSGGTGASSAAGARTNLGITPANIGALPKVGGAMTGDIDFGNINAGLTWATANGTLIRFRPDASENVLQILMSTNNGSSWTSVFNIKTDGTIGFKSNAPLPIASGGTGAVTAAGARVSLGITPANIGALPTDGGDMSGNINFGTSAADVRWTTGDGTMFRMRPDASSGAFQILMTQDGTTSSVFNISKDGTIGFKGNGALPIASGGTGAKTAADACTNLGIKDYVVEQGTVSAGTNVTTVYRKWNSGFMEQWYQALVTNQAINTQYGSLYTGTHTWTFAKEFKYIDCVQCSCFRYEGSSSWGAVSLQAADYAVLNGYDIQARATGTICNISAYAQGSWK